MVCMAFDLYFQIILQPDRSNITLLEPKGKQSRNTARLEDDMDTWTLSPAAAGACHYIRLYCKHPRTLAKAILVTTSTSYEADMRI